MRIFVDVGGYRGHSTLAALDPLFAFDRVVCFEPVPHLLNLIRRIKDPRLLAVGACLSNKTGSTTLYNPGTLAASIFEDAPPYGGTAPPIVVPKLEASAFLDALVQDDDEIWIKLNCEGSEIDILENILDEKRLLKPIRAILADFDARKIPTQSHRVGPLIERLTACEVPFWTPDQCQFGMITNYGGVRNFLLVSGAGLFGSCRMTRSFAYNARMALNSEINGYHKMRMLRILPWLSRFARSHKSRVARL